MRPAQGCRGELQTLDFEGCGVSVHLGQGRRGHTSEARLWTQPQYLKAFRRVLQAVGRGAAWKTSRVAWV